MLDEDFIMSIFHDIGKCIPEFKNYLDYFFEIKKIKDCCNSRGDNSFLRVECRDILSHVCRKPVNGSGFNNIGFIISDHDNYGIGRK